MLVMLMLMLLFSLLRQLYIRYRNTANSYGEEQQQALMMTSLQGEVENSMPIINTTIMDTSNYKPRYLYRYLNVIVVMMMIIEIVVV